MKILYFVNGPATAEDIEIAGATGAKIRNALVGGETDYLESADAVFGAIPKRYEKYSVYEEGAALLEDDKMTAKELIAAIEACDSLEEFSKLVDEDESRKTVIAAMEKRMDELQAE